MKIGCHVSIAGGIENAPKRAHQVGAGCFQIFSRSPHGGKAKEITALQIKNFLSQNEKYGFEPSKDYVIHSPYYINMASENNRIYYGSISALRKELEVANLLKAPFVVTHIGSSKDLAGDDIEKQISDKVMKALIKIHENYSGSSKLLLEIAAGSGNIIGDTLEEIGDFIKQCKKEKINVGFCFDTCHSFVAGYDQRTPEDVSALFSQIDKEIGLDQLGCIHLNDSMGKLGSNLDRHDHIGHGEIGEQGLKATVLQAKKLAINIFIETKAEKIIQDIEKVKGFLLSI